MRRVAVAEAGGGGGIGSDSRLSGGPTSLPACDGGERVVVKADVVAVVFAVLPGVVIVGEPVVVVNVFLSDASSLPVVQLLLPSASSCSEPPVSTFRRAGEDTARACTSGCEAIRAGDVSTDDGNVAVGAEANLLG